MSWEEYFPVDGIRDVLIACLFFCMVASTVAIDQPINSDFEITFTAYRLRQFTLSGISYGSRAARFAYDVVPLKDSVIRRCLVVRWSDLQEQSLQEVVEGNAGAVLIVLPKGLKPLTSREGNKPTLEEELAQFSTDQAVYFAETTSELETLAKSAKITKAPTAFQQMLNLFVENAFQVSTTLAGNPAPVTSNHFNIIGKLSAPERNAPTVVIVAHYDSKGIVPSLSTGYDSNGSGALALVALMQKLAQYYKMDNMRPKLNTVFALTTLGAYNYQGSRKLADDLVESQEKGERTLLVISLESLMGGDKLYAHISKNLQEKTAPYNFLNRMKYFTPVSKERVIKQNSQIKQDAFNWEHEVYFKNRLSALTLSHFESATDPARTTILNDVDIDNEEVLFEKFNEKVRLIAETLFSYVFNIDLEWCTEALREADECHILPKANFLSKNNELRQIFQQPRPAHALPPNLVQDLFKLVKSTAQTAKSQQFQSTELQVYDNVKDELVAQVVKPALFEIVLAMGVGMYVFVVFHWAQNSQELASSAVKMFSKPKTQ
ncbi:unnamed protein product [Bursaphelenchus okinawaensis]|uniref:BOS complex subunit NCLN n=1 Tax=Bursaphelenchus okinawaensis TaxID=465554 RepID=A0A811JSC9_9BILA|nr:unnamed protein product [Bursaphelenchus okinawaensis]CAG9080374.1 unnamed protein product [Bursaphelenchus okinawaensis]